MKGLPALVCALALTGVSVPAAAVKYGVDSEAWTDMPPLPVAVSHHRAVATAKALIVIGGRDSSEKPLDQVLRASLGRTGKVKEWKKSRALPVGLSEHSIGILNGIIYVCGGLQAGRSGGAVSDAVWMARVTDAGAVSAWSRGASLPRPVHGHGQAVHRNWIYIAGGMSNGTYRREVLRGDVGPDGKVRSWGSVLSLPVPLVYPAVIAVDSYLIVIGGRSAGQGKSLIVPTVYVGPIWEDGTITTWYLASSKLPGAWMGFGRSHTSACSYGSSLFCFGGQDALWFLLDNYTSAVFDVERGEISNWGVSPGPAAMPRLTSAVVWKKYVYLIGGVVEGRASRKVLRGTFKREKKR